MAVATRLPYLLLQIKWTTSGSKSVKPILAKTVKFILAFTGESMRKFLVFLLAVFILSLVGCSEQERDTPPLPIITVEGKELKVAHGSYCWNGPNSSSCVDMISPPEIMKHFGMKPVVVPPQSEVKIQFHEEPNESGGSMWLTNEKSEKVPITNNVLKLPNEEGVYVYDIYGHWEQGSASYVFVIEVR
jgi:hypothetical protein